MLFSAKEMETRKFGKLHIKNPKSITSGSGVKEIWICDCGKETEAYIFNVISKKTISCGRCSEISEEEMKIRKFGKLQMKFPKAVLPGSNKEEVWICNCGKEKSVKIVSVISGVTISCGRCNEISAEKMSTQKFGRLRMKFPKITLPGSTKKEIWVCDCGVEKEIPIIKVVSGHTTSCGNCRNLIHEWYLKNKDQICSLVCPIKPEQFPVGGFIPLEVIRRTDLPFRCRCFLCGGVYYPRFHDIKRGNGGLTCGCSSYRISSEQKNISLFIESLGFPNELEFSVNKLKYDIFVPQINLLIEYDGTHWHNMKGSKERDVRKEQNAVSFGYEFFRITEEEWTKNHERTEDQLRRIVKSTEVS